MPAHIVQEDNTALTRLSRKTTPAAALAALGIVYGDLGTSPLYTLQAIVGVTGGHFSAEAALGSLSLIFWALIITISIKYCLFVMRSDSHGEGGILALMSMTGAYWCAGAGAPYSPGFARHCPPQKRCLPTWDISAAIRSAHPGMGSCCRRCSSIMRARSRSSWAIRRSTAIRSSDWRRHGRSLRSWDLP